jgi:hypothetical protein
MLHPALLEMVEQAEQTLIPEVALHAAAVVVVLQLLERRELVALVVGVMVTTLVLVGQEL